MYLQITFLHNTVSDQILLPLNGLLHCRWQPFASIVPVRKEKWIGRSR